MRTAVAKGVTATLAAFAALGALALAACGSPRPQAPAPAYASRDIRKDEILMLDGKILDHRRALGLAPRPDPAILARAHDEPVVAPPPPAPAASGNRCLEACELAGYICKAQEDICRLADELGEDAWARAKCDAAKASCAEAKKRCLDCGKRPEGRP
jgi:hypothetical protein